MYISAHNEERSMMSFYEVFMLTKQKVFSEGLRAAEVTSCIFQAGQVTANFLQAALTAGSRARTKEPYQTETAHPPLKLFVAVSRGLGRRVWFALEDAMTRSVLSFVMKKVWHYYLVSTSQSWERSNNRWVIRGILGGRTTSWKVLKSMYSTL